MELLTGCEVWVYLLVPSTDSSEVLDGDVYRLPGGGHFRPPTGFAGLPATNIYTCRMTAFLTQASGECRKLACLRGPARPCLLVAISCSRDLEPGGA